ncbi:type 1 fimbrial protein [Salmonella enterica]|uniref:Type 1 fimbrial protein n=1 Tax=Salmonella enterica TaxID=28901 RepID=A0A763UU18_SALER|nr:type 1 fimbrial protein [Salmonella enterica subsp. enterica serovar Pomona]EHI2276998.1 type 1 fimbrial protein [Salmonella enterica]HAF2158293.1 type 1 fimbrial protein [Salmonella enterica]HAF2414153.1 type 1 fimbrial protein [Salmonella enterica]HAF4921601.1 type 1 fimbrial protein [Salmonella enterica]
MRILNTVCQLSLLTGLILACGGAEAGLRLYGRATMRGEVVASACTIALADRFQSVPMGELPLRDLQSGHGRTTRDFVIHLDNCSTSGRQFMAQETDPAIRVRFDGLRGNRPGLFRTLGDARGVALQLQDARQEIVYPGEYLPVLYQKAYNQQVLQYRVSLVPDGNALAGGDYSAALRFSINYE